MLNRTLILAIGAVIAIVVGAALGFFELIVLGILGATVSVVLALRTKPTHAESGR